MTPKPRVKNNKKIEKIELWTHIPAFEDNQKELEDNFMDLEKKVNEIINWINEHEEK